MAIPDKRPLKVFLCHAHADRDAVRALYNRLVKDGVDAWLDKEKMLPGQNWRHEILKAVKEADVVIVCHSKEFNKEGFRQREVKWALDAALEKPEGEIFIIPARLEECDVLESLSDWNWVDLFESDGYERLMRALRVRAEKIGATLQEKRYWPPKVSAITPRTEPKKYKMTEEKVESSTGVLPAEKVSLGWKNKKRPLSVYKEDANQTVREDISSEVSGSSNRLNKSVPAWIFVISLLILIVLGSFAPKIFGLGPMQTSTFTVTASKLPKSTMTFTAMLPNKTPLPSWTPTKPFTPTFTYSPSATFELRTINFGGTRTSLVKQTITEENAFGLKELARISDRWDYGTISHNGKFIFYSKGAVIYATNIEDGRVVETLVHNHNVYGFSVSKDDRIIVSVSGNKEISVWNIEERKITSHLTVCS